MGVFDYVRYEADCPHCGKRLTEFQTKDGDPYMNTVEPKDVWEWYALCACGAFVTFAWERAFDKPPRMTFDPPNDKAHSCRVSEAKEA